MKKLLLLIFLIGSALYAQTPITTNTLILPKQTARAAAPTTGAKLYDFFHAVEIRDSIGFTRVITGRDTIYFLHASDLTPYALKTTTISTTLPLTGGGDLSANRTLAINPATPQLPGSMSAEDKTKINTLEDYTRNLGSAAMADISQFVQARDPEVKVIATNGENNIVLTTQLSTRTRIYYNGSLVENTRWAGVGTTTLTLSLDTKIYDMIIINY